MTFLDYGKATPLYSLWKRVRSWSESRERVKTFREWSTRDQVRLEFYRQFVQPGELVFDVGANLGNRAKVFAKLGATVVAVEPQAVCGDFLETMFTGDRRFHLVRKGLGAAPGTAEMLVSSEHAISSFSPEWVHSVQVSGRFAQQRWDERQTVEIDTLDRLIAKFGRPAFVKIDVEGFEHEVVAGLSTAVRGLSLEFASEYLSGSVRCIDHLTRLGDSQFQISLGESMTFLLKEWVGAADVKRELQRLPSAAFGDVYVRMLGDI